MWGSELFLPQTNAKIDALIDLHRDPDWVMFIPKSSPDSSIRPAHQEQ